MKKNLLKIFLSVAVLAGIVYSCKDDKTMFKVQDKAIDIKNAQLWYESHMPPIISLKAGSADSRFINVKPNWKEAYRRQNKQFTTVEAVVMSQGRINFISPECKKKFEETKDTRYKQSLTRLVVRTDRKTNAKIGFLMTIMPSLKYLEETNFKPFHSTYIKRDPNFSGYIIYHDLNGKFVNGWKYLNGKITHTVKMNNNSNSHLNLKSSSDYEECTTYEYWVEVLVYEEWSKVNEYGEEVVTGETPLYTYWELRDTWEECVWIYEDDGSGGDYGGDVVSSDMALWEAEIIVDSTLNKNPCVRKIYDSLMKADAMYKAVNGFMEKTPVAHLNWDIGDLGGQNDGKTSYDSYKDPFNVYITLDVNYLHKAASISIVRTMIHEAIHAELFREMIMVGMSPSVTDFPGIFDFYTRYKSGIEGTPQHNLIAAYYRNQIKSALKAFDKTNNINRTEEDYDALSWGSLQGTRPWNELNSHLRDDIYTPTIQFFQSNIEYWEDPNRNC